MKNLAINLLLDNSCDNCVHFYQAKCIFKISNKGNIIKKIPEDRICKNWRTMNDVQRGDWDIFYYTFLEKNSGN